jgi:RNA polymerase sigma factor (sigma-70 family)
VARVALAEDEPDPSEGTAGRLDDARRAERALRALAAMPERDQELFALCVWQELSYEEAAIALGIPVGTVRSRLSRARSRLRGLLGEPASERGDGPDVIPDAQGRKEGRI